MLVKSKQTFMVPNSECKMKTEDDKYYPQIYLEEPRYKKRNPWKRGETSKVMKVMMSLPNKSENFTKIWTEYFYNTKYKRDVSILPPKNLDFSFILKVFTHTHTHTHTQTIDKLLWIIPLG